MASTKRGFAPSGSSWFGQRSLRGKLNTIVLVYVAIVLALLLVATVASGLNNGLRAYVQGEGLWSKGQKDAVYYLTRYAHHRDAADYRKYLESIAIPLGDRIARMELQKSAFDYGVAERGFLAGANAPEDIPYMITLFRHFHDVGYLAAAIQIWTLADAEILRLVQTADKIHAAISAGNFTAATERQLVDQLEQVNASLTPLEQRFSAILGEGTRVMRRVVLNSIVLLATALLGGGLAISMWISRGLQSSIRSLHEGAVRVAAGDLSTHIEVRSRDEIGELGQAFNEMIDHRRRADQQVALHRQFEALITRLSTSMISLTLGEVDEGIHRALEEIGQFAGVDRSYIFAFDDSGARVSCTHEWCGEDIAPQIQRLQDLQVADFPWVEAQLQRGEVVHVPRMSELPPEAASERAEWEAESIRSLLLVPTSLGGKVVGYVGFDSVSAEKAWSKESITLLKIFGEMVVNVLQRKQSDAVIRQLAHHDPLTKLPNRRLLMDRLDMALEQARRRHNQVAVLMLDLDHFKNINDSLGHAVGDQLLLAVADRLAGCIRKTDTVARMGGDEFVIVLAGVDGREVVERVAQEMIEQVRTPIVIGSHELVITPSIGICFFPTDGADGTELLKKADTAMYQAKTQGRSNYQWFNPSMLLAADARLDLENSLRRALERNEFSIHYQPLVTIETGQAVGMEALLRWNHPHRGTVPPEDFITLAEETGLILPIGEWALRKACVDGKRLQDQLGYPLIVSVNISTRQFRQDNLHLAVREALLASGLSASTLVLEITESVLATNPKSTVATLDRIRELGVRIAVDDFGTGYSSLSYITRFPIDFLKVDRSFVRDIADDKNDAAITSAIIAMAHSLGIQVIAEGVETLEQFAFLKERHCDEAQGFYFAEPVPVEEFAPMVRKLDGAHWRHCEVRDRAEVR